MPLLRGLFRSLRNKGSRQFHKLSYALRLNAFLLQIVREIPLRGAVRVHAPAVYRDGDFLRGNLLHPKGSGGLVQPVFERGVVERLVMLVSAVKHSDDFPFRGCFLSAVEHR